MEGGLETENSVVERGHSTAVAWEDSLFLENLTQSNKGFVVMLSVQLKNRKRRLFQREEKHRSHSVGGFGRLRHSHVIKHQNSSGLKSEMTSESCYNFLPYIQTIP